MLTDLVKGETHFIKYYDGNLWYIANGFAYPIPIEDTKGGIFLVRDKAIVHMRWIRKHYENYTQKGLNEH